MHKLSVIILSYALSDEIYQMNCRLLKTLHESESWDSGELQVLILETAKNTTYSYEEYDDVVVFSPEEKFGFHSYFNIGVKMTDGEYIAFCNNDIIFKDGWFSAITRVADAHPKFLCFSPLDDSGNFPKMMPDVFPRDKEYYLGWENQKYFAPWCFVWKRKVFDIVGKFDETFDFFAADADECNTLRKNAIYSVLCTKSVVLHDSGQTVIRENKIREITDSEKYPLTAWEKSKGKDWVYQDVRFYIGYQREKAKWGNDLMMRRVERFITRFPIFNVRWITRLLYSRKGNDVLCALTGLEKAKVFVVEE